MVELVDALDSKSSVGDNVWVRVPPQAPLGNLFELFELIDIESIERLVFFCLKKEIIERLVSMLKVIKKEIDMEESLKKRLEIICDFCNTTPTIINGSIRNIDKTNLNYIEPHRIIINNIMFLAFNYSNEIYINNLSKKIKIAELENYIKSMN